MNNKLSRRIVARTIAAKLLAEPTPARRKHWLQVTAAYLLDQKQADDVDLVVNDIAHELYEQSGHLAVDVVSAHALSASVREELKKTLQASTSAKHVELSEQLDPQLLGGLVARTPDAELDLSVRTKLKQLATI